MSGEEEFGQILWPKTDATGKPGSAAARPRFDAWGGRYQGNMPAEGNVVDVLAVPELSGVPPQAIGVNLFRSDRQATLYNSDVKARVTYGAGRSGQMQFDCDWRGGFVVHASRLEVQALAYKLPSVALYQAAKDVILSATAGLNGSRPAHPPTYTVLPTDVLTTATRQIEIPLLARRVVLLMRYGTLGVTGDAPLGQAFLSFADYLGNALCWLDASTTRAAVFGEGVSVPAGAYYIGLTNTSGATMALGALFHLGL